MSRNVNDGNDKARADGDDVVAKLMHFQQTGEGFEGLWADLHPIVVEFSRRHLRKLGIAVPADGEDGAVGDVVNDTAVKLCSLSEPGAGGRFDPAQSSKPGLSGVRAWLWRVVWSRAADWCRDWKGGRGMKIISESCLEWNELPDGDGGSILKWPVAKIERAALLPILAECINRLDDPKLRAVVWLKLDEELAERPTAKRLKTSVTTVHRRLKKAYDLLRPMLEERGVDASWLAA